MNNSKDGNDRNINAEYDHIFKILLIGDSSVGKSSILLRYTDDQFNVSQLSTIGVDFRTKFINVNGKRIKLALWDTAGQDRFRTLTTSYYRGAQGIILAYDVSNKNTFENLPFWLDEVMKNSTNKNVVKMLIANKVDLDSIREVTLEEGRNFAFSESMLFVETSAKTKFNISYAFEELVLKILEIPSLLKNTSNIQVLDGKKISEVSNGDDNDQPMLSNCSC